MRRRAASPGPPGRAVPRLLALGGGLLGLVALAPAAAASCPPFDLDRTPYALLAARPSKADEELILRGGVLLGVPVGLWPVSGPAPLRVGVLWTHRPQSPQAIELDADGDGTPEVVDTRDENLGHVYARPGTYAATIRVRGADGSLSTYPTVVTVMTRAAFEALLQSRWAALRTALARGDFAAALDCVHSNRRRRLEPSLRFLLRRDVERALPPIRFVEVRGMGALCLSQRPPPGRAQSSQVRFLMDHDGVWRLADFFQGDDRP